MIRTDRSLIFDFEVSCRNALAMLKSWRFTLLTLFGICTLIYYFGQLVDFAGWKALRWEFFYEVHDTHRLLFLVPIIYAGYFFGTKEAIIVTIASLIAFLPRAIFASPFPDAVLRAILSTIAIGGVGFLIAMMRDEPLVRNEGDDGIGTREGIEDGVFTAGTLEIDLPRRLIKHRGQIVKLTPTEYEILSCLVRGAGKVLSHAELVRCVWGPEYGHQPDYLHTFLWQLRHKIEDDPSNPQFIVTERGVGYRFVIPE
jgi:DNA-binding winged helix-turn-helix (wHTH) protein